MTTQIPSGKVLHDKMVKLREELKALENTSEDLLYICDCTREIDEGEHTIIVGNSYGYVTRAAALDGIKEYASTLSPGTTHSIELRSEKHYRESFDTGDFSVNWYFTFGFNHPFRNYYVTLYNMTHEQAREKMIETYGMKWAFQYSSEDFEGQPEKYGLAEIEFGCQPQFEPTNND